MILDLQLKIMKDFLQLSGYFPESRIKLNSLVIDLQVNILLYLIISFAIMSYVLNNKLMVANLEL